VGIGRRLLDLAQLWQDHNCGRHGGNLSGPLAPPRRLGVVAFRAASIRVTSVGIRRVCVPANHGVLREMCVLDPAVAEGNDCVR
jgi:hypothetical protein